PGRRRRHTVGGNTPAHVRPDHRRPVAARAVARPRVRRRSRRCGADRRSGGTGIGAGGLRAATGPHLGGPHASGLAAAGPIPASHPSKDRGPYRAAAVAARRGSATAADHRARPPGRIRRLPAGAAPPAHPAVGRLLLTPAPVLYSSNSRPRPDTGA